MLNRIQTNALHATNSLSEVKKNLNLRAIEYLDEREGNPEENTKLPIDSNRSLFYNLQQNDVLGGKSSALIIGQMTPGDCRSNPRDECTHSVSDILMGHKQYIRSGLKNNGGKLFIIYGIQSSATKYSAILVQYSINNLSFITVAQVRVYRVPSTQYPC